MSKIVYFFSILTLTSTHHLTLTINYPKNIFAVSIIHQMDNKTWNYWNRPTDSWDIIFSGILSDFANDRYKLHVNQVLIMSSPVILSIYLKIIATEGFSLQNVSLVSLEWHIKTLLRWSNGKYTFLSFVVFSGVILHLPQSN